MNEHPVVFGYPHHVICAGAGYLAGPVGLLTNAATSTLKVGVKICAKIGGGRILKIVLKLGHVARDALEMVFRYIKLSPNKPLGSLLSEPSAWIRWGGEACAELINTFKVLTFSVFHFTGEAIEAGNRLLLTRISTRTLNHEATEGVTLAIQRGSRHVFEEVFEGAARYSDEVIEAAATRYVRLCKRFPAAEFSDDAIRGMHVAAEAVGHDGVHLLDEIVQGSAMTAERAEKSFSNFSKLRGTSGMDDMVWFLKHNATNGNGIDGAVFESTVARRVVDSQVPSVGAIERVSADGLPGQNRIDTLTSTHAFQVKHKRTGNYTPSDLGSPRAAAEEYLDSLALQSSFLGKTPALVTNCPVNDDLLQMLTQRGIQWLQVLE